MDLPRTKIQQAYTDEIKVIESNIKDISNGEAPAELFKYAQDKLDKLADRFQDDEKLGTARYKLYELQALLYYFQNRDKDAMDFIEQAIEVKGASYRRAEQLIERLGSSSRQIASSGQELARSHKQGKLTGINGWLALFTLGLGLSVLLNLFSLVGYPEAFDNVSLAQTEAPDFVAAMNPLLWFEVIQHVALVGILVLLIVFLFMRKRSAKPLAIAVLVGTVVAGIVDYAWASSIFDSFNLDLDGELDEAAGDIVRGIIAAMLWIPYFIVSKRVKATLTD